MSDSDARAARNAARATPISATLGAETFTFLPEIPLDVALALNTLGIQTFLEGAVWLEAHVEKGAECDTSCADDGFPLLARGCPTEQDFRKRLKKARNADGSRLTEKDWEAFHDDILGQFAVSQGESEPSAPSSPTAAGGTSSAIASEQA